MRVLNIDSCLYIPLLFRTLNANVPAFLLCESVYLCVPVCFCVCDVEFHWEIRLVPSDFFLFCFLPLHFELQFFFILTNFFFKILKY